MNRILVPCDFSKHAIHAFGFAVSMAKALQGRIEVLFAIDFGMMTDPISGAEPIIMEPHFYSAVEKQTRARFADMLKRHASDFEAVTLKIETGSLLPVMIREMERLQPFCVVMGTRGASGIKEIFIGSNTEKVVRFAPCPVFAIRDFIEFSSIKNIIHPTELRLNQTDFINRLKTLQGLTKATLHVLYINEPGRPVSEEELREYCRHYGLTDVTLSIRDNADKVDEIICFSAEREGDLVAMATHARHGLAHLVSGSVSEDVVNHIQTAVWTYSLKPVAHELSVS